MPRASRTWTLLTFIGACAAIAAWTAARGPVADLAAAWPAPAEIDSLRAYTQPTPPLPPIDDYAVHLPAMDPDPGFAEYPVADAPDVVAEPAATWRVSAILISSGRPVAIVNDQQVRPGDRLEGGATVESIESSRVIIADSQGRRHSLGVSPGE